VVRGATPTGTFLDRTNISDLRVATWNVYNDSVFTTRQAKFDRVADAVDADVWCFQEMYSHTPAQTKTLMDTVRPLGTSSGWHVYQSGEHAIASKFPLSMGRNDTAPVGYRPIAMALSDLPDSRFTNDLYLMDVHYRCCGDTANDPFRQKQSDALVNWMHDARTPGGTITLPAGTAMAVLGDYNLVGGPQPLNTLLDGNIIDNTTYGADSAPDWDGGTNADAFPRHNNDPAGPTWTWRNDNDVFAPGRLDFVTWTDSVLASPKRFVLNSFSMTAADRAAVGMQQYDTLLDNVGANYDHLPVVIDFAATVSQWGVDAGGAWSNAGNWTLGVPGGAGARASLLQVPTASRTVTLDADVTIGELFMDNAAGYRVLGAAGMGLNLQAAGAGATARLSVASGSHEIAADLILSSPTVIEVAGTAALKLSGEVAGTAKIAGLAIAPGATLDLTRNSQVVAGGDVAALTQLVRNGYHGGAWDGVGGIVTTTEDATKGLTSIGVASAATGYAGKTFRGLSVASGDVIVMYTYAGDANLDGFISGDDYSAIDFAIAVPGASGWSNGDFNYDGFISGDDYSTIDFNIVAQGAPFAAGVAGGLAGVAAVPEPSGLAFAAAAMLGAEAGRRRR
jgi:hypothetical protein